MRRGITPVVAIALLLGMTVAASGAAYTFVSQAQQGAQEDASAALATQVEVRDLRCEDAAVEVALKNSGDTDLSGTSLDAYLYTDGTLSTTAEVDISGSDVRQADGLSILSLPFVLDPGAAYTVEFRVPADDVSVESSCQARVQNLAGYWDFDVFEAHTIFDGARDNDGTLHGVDMNGALGATEAAETNDPEWRGGCWFGGCLEFDRSESDRVSAGNIPAGGHMDVDQRFTVSFWANASQTGSGHQGVISTGDETRTWNVRNSGGEMQFRVYGEETYTSGEDVQVGDFEYWTFVLNDTEWTWYRDGTQVNSGANGYQFVYDDLFIGRYHGQDTFPGQLDDLRIYDKALTDEQIGSVMSGDIGVPGLVAYYPMDEGEGQTVWNNAFQTEGQPGQGLRLDGDDDYVDVGRPLEGSVSEFTLSGWMKKQGDNNGYGGIFGSENQSAWRVALRSPEDDKTAMGYVRASSNCIVSGSTEFEYGEWHHVTLTFDDGTTRFYFDGENEDENTCPSDTFNFDKVSRLDIGQQYGSSLWNGSLDDIRIYNTALSSDQIGALYNSTN